MRWPIPKYFPGWFVSGGGGGGGAATVQTDGVTIQGDGSAGNKIAIKQVETDASLSGAGTLASPLAEVPATYFSMPNAVTTGFTPSTPSVYVAGFVLPTPFTLSTITIWVSTNDAVGLYDCGLYNQAGTRVAHCGPQTLPNANSWTALAMIGAPIALPPGNYLWAFTGAATATFGFDNSHQIQNWYQNNNVASATAFTLPASIGAQVVTAGKFNLIVFALS